jgi:hypothetical protein
MLPRQQIQVETRRVLGRLWEVSGRDYEHFFPIDLPRIVSGEGLDLVYAAEIPTTRTGFQTAGLID